MTTFVQKKKVTFNIKDFIDDDVESGGEAEEEKELQIHDTAEPKERFKKRSKKQIEAEKAEEERLSNFYEVDNDAEKVTDDEKTRKRMRLFVAQQEEKDWQDVEQWAQDLQEHEEEQKRAWDLLEKNKKLIQAEKERSDVPDAAHYEELVRKARAQLDEEKAQRVRDAEDRKSSSSSVKPVPKSKPKPKPIVLKEANFQFDCVWSIGHNQFLVHRVGFDQLGTLSIEKEYKGFREKMQNSYHLLYPFKNAKCGLALQKIAPQFNWYEFWIKPLSSFPNLPPSLESFITAEREGVLKECCEAFWPTSDDEVFLVHFAFFPCRQRNSLLSVAFHLVEKNLCPSLFDSYQRRLIMMPDVVARYPWRNGDDGVALLEENSSDIHLTYQELKIMKNERN